MATVGWVTSLLAFAFSLGMGSASASTTKKATSPLTAEQIFEKCSPAVVSILTTVRGESAERGTGTVMAPEGFIITNAHVISRAEEISVDVGESEMLPASLRQYDESSDLAVLVVARKLSKGLVLQRIEARVGQAVFAIGNPQGLRRSISEGIVSGLREDPHRALIQHTAPISPGSSGGPLLSRFGELVGINTFQLTESQNLNFAISSRELRDAIAVATKQKVGLPLPATLRRQELNSLTKAAYERGDYRVCADLAREAIKAQLEPTSYYEMMLGMSLVELGQDREAQPLLEAAANGDGDAPTKQTARYYLLSSLFNRFTKKDSTVSKAQLVHVAKEILSSGPLNGDLAVERKSASEILKVLLDPSGAWYDADRAFSRIFKGSVLEIQCEESKCAVRVKEHTGGPAGMHETAAGHGSYDNETLTGTYTFTMVFAQPGHDPYALWQQEVTFSLKWSQNFDALDGEVVWNRWQFHTMLSDDASRLKNLLYPTRIAVKLVPIDQSP